jgi:hypothetical protein
MRRQVCPPREARLADRAAKQHGVVKHAHLMELGFSRSGIRRMAQAGRLHPLHRGVYAVGHPAVSFKGKLLAAVYASGDRAVLSHHQAAWLWRLRRGTGGSRIHITVPARGLLDRSGIQLHQVRSLHEDDVTVLDGIPVTSVARTLLDMAECADANELRRMLEEAERLRIFDLRAMEAACARGNGRRGVARARRAARDAHPDPPWTRSDLELAFFEFCREEGIPEPSVNVWVEGQEVDMAWSDPRVVVVELDSYAYHGTREAFERDRVRSADLAVAGVPCIRVTQRRLTRERPGLRKHLLSLLAVSG